MLESESDIAGRYSESSLTPRAPGAGLGLVRTLSIVGRLALSWSSPVLCRMRLEANRLNWVRVSFLSTQFTGILSTKFWRATDFCEGIASGDHGCLSEGLAPGRNQLAGGYGESGKSNTPSLNGG